MTELCHRIKAFVFQYAGAEPRYLLLRAQTGIESFWTPLHGPIGFGEKLDTAIRREVLHEAGIGCPQELIDLQMPYRWLLGDEEVIEWQFGVRAEPRREDLRLDGRWAEFRWADFAEAYPCLEFEQDRAAITRLHTLLHAA